LKTRQPSFAGKSTPLLLREPYTLTLLHAAGRAMSCVVPATICTASPPVQLRPSASSIRAGRSFASFAQRCTSVVASVIVPVPSIIVIGKITPRRPSPLCPELQVVQGGHDILMDACRPSTAKKMEWPS
jgi:hypothetical protein